VAQAKNVKIEDHEGCPSDGIHSFAYDAENRTTTLAGMNTPDQTQANSAGYTVSTAVWAQCPDNSQSRFFLEWMLCGFGNCDAGYGGGGGDDGRGGGGGGGGGASKPGIINQILGLRAPGQTWSQCMSANANTYSIGGSIELAADAAFSKNTSISSYTSPVTGNAINTLFFGSGSDAASSMAAGAPGLGGTAMGSATTFGRRTSSIMSLNLAGTPGGPAVALSKASGGIKAALGRIGNVLSLGMSFATRTAIDIGFTGAEAINCAIPN
jgi:hypothetical protein